MSIQPILDRAVDGRELSPKEGIALLSANDDWHEPIRQAADALNTRLNGDRVSYVVNRNYNFTNVCYTNCAFCGFKRPAGHEEAWDLELDRLPEVTAEFEDVDELCVQGGINPKHDLDYYCELLRGLKKWKPTVHLHAFSAQEIWELSRRTGIGIDTILDRLKEAGLGSIPGTAAENFHPDIRAQIAPGKLPAADWFRIHHAAHDRGIPSNGTIMFGHLEEPHHLIYHLELFKQEQRRDWGFTEFVPLLFIPYDNPLGHRLDMHETKSWEYIQRFYAVTRLYLGETVRNLQTSWVKLGMAGALEILEWGANDFGGTLMSESITRMSGGSHGTKQEEEAIVQAIRGRGKTPWRRTTAYGEVLPDGSRIPGPGWAPAQSRDLAAA